jgi:hypothetical protein
MPYKLKGDEARHPAAGLDRTTFTEGDVRE